MSNTKLCKYCSFTIVCILYRNFIGYQQGQNKYPFILPCCRCTYWVPLVATTFRPKCNVVSGSDSSLFGALDEEKRTPYVGTISVCPSASYNQWLEELVRFSWKFGIWYTYKYVEWAWVSLKSVQWFLTNRVNEFLRQDQIYEIFSVPIPKISERGNHKWCNIWKSSQVHIPGYANQ